MRLPWQPLASSSKISYTDAYGIGLTGLWQLPVVYSPLCYCFYSKFYSKQNDRLSVTLHNFWWSHPIGRVVYRGYNNANANGGLSNANANNDASNSNTNVGSRLTNNESANITGNVFPPMCRGWQTTATASSDGKLKNQVVSRVW